jgi:hypothetical protein
VPKKRSRSKFMSEEVQTNATSDPLGIETIALALAHSHETVVVKTVNETVNNSDVLQDDDELFFPVLAGEIWDVELIARYTSVAAQDFRFAFSVPGSGTAAGIVHRLGAGAANVADDQLNWMDVTAVSGASGGLGGAGNDVGLHCRVLVTVGAAEGNVTFQWAQFVAAANNTVVYAGSYLVARKVS